MTPKTMMVEMALLASVIAKASVSLRGMDRLLSHMFPPPGRSRWTDTATCRWIWKHAGRWPASGSRHHAGARGAARSRSCSGSARALKNSLHSKQRNANCRTFVGDVAGATASAERQTRPPHATAGRFWIKRGSSACRRPSPLPSPLPTWSDARGRCGRGLPPSRRTPSARSIRRSARRRRGR